MCSFQLLGQFVDMYILPNRAAHGKAQIKLLFYAPAADLYKGGRLNQSILEHTEHLFVPTDVTDV